MNVQRWMTRTVITCQPEDSLQRAAQLLWDYDLGALPVIDGTHRLVGIITDRDLCMAAFTRGSPLATHTVERPMARKVYTLQPQDSLARAHELMRKHQVRRLPVVDDGGMLMGVMTVVDVTRAAGSIAKRARAKAAHELTATFGAIAQRRVAQPAKAVAPVANAVLEPKRASKKKPATTSAIESPARGTPASRASARGGSARRGSARKRAARTPARSRAS